MNIKKTVFLLMLLVCEVRPFCTTPLLEQLKHVGYIEICNENHGAATFDALYAYFDEFIEFLQKNPVWAQKVDIAKKRFLCSQERHFYSTDAFGFYDESETETRRQTYFYYTIHLHEFMDSYCKEFKQIPQITRFLDACCEIQKPYAELFNKMATELGLETVFSSHQGHPPILLKVIKYLPSYRATGPHYDGTAFTLFLDSTNNQSLFLSPYKSSFTISDFFSPLRDFSRSYHQNSIILIPGTLLTEEFAIYPTPHIVIESDTDRYATIVFVRRPYYNVGHKNTFSSLPSFRR